MNGLWVLSWVVHVYVALRLLPGVAQAAGIPSAGVLGALLLASAVLIPFALRRRKGKRSAAEARRADLLAWASLTLMGLFSSLFVLTLLRDLAALAAGAATFAGAPAVPERWRDLSSVAVVLLALLVTLAGLYDARKPPQVKTVDVPLKDLPPALEGFRIAQISDMHIGPTIKRPAMKHVVAAINRLDVDLVAITGDLVDGNVHELSRHVAPLAGLRSRHGTFFVTGNHEYYSGVDEWLAFLGTLGVRVLRNERVAIRGDQGFDLAGIDDASAAAHGHGHGADLPRAVAGRDTSRPLVLLAHQPKGIDLAERLGVDLQLSGHTHGGQLFPWNFVVKLVYPFIAGLYRQGRTQVYVSEGTGYWGPPMRVGTSAEITHIELLVAPALRS